MDTERRRMIVEGGFVVAVGMLAGFAQPYVLGPGPPNFGPVAGYAIFTGLMIFAALRIVRIVSRRLYP